MTALPLPEDVIPHRHPFLFLSEVIEVDPDRGARGYWSLGEQESFFAGHFPGRPTLPCVLMIEAMAQLGAYAVLSSPKATAKLPLFGGVDRVRFRRQVVPGDRLDLEVELGHMSARAGRGHGRASVDGEVACEADLLFVFVDSSQG